MLLRSAPPGRKTKPKMIPCILGLTISGIINHQDKLKLINAWCYFDFKVFQPPHFTYYKRTKSAFCYVLRIKNTRNLRFAILVPCVQTTAAHSSSDSGSEHSVVAVNPSSSSWGGRGRSHHKGCLPRGSFDSEDMQPSHGCTSSRQLRRENFVKETAFNSGERPTPSPPLSSSLFKITK